MARGTADDRRKQCVAFLLLGMVTLTGCYRYADLTPASAPRLSSSKSPPENPVVVQTIDGERVRIDDFDVVIVYPEQCLDKPCRTKHWKFNAPVQIEYDEGFYSFEAPNRKQRFATGSVSRITVAERAPDRIAIVVGVAVVLGLATGYLTYRATGGCGPPSEEGGPVMCGEALAAVLAGGAVGGLSVVVTSPLTRSLGTPVD
jgi:hypothetical protein